MNLFQLFYRPRAGEHRVIYLVRGSADDYNVTFKCSEGCEVIQKPHVRRGWKHSFTGKVGDYVYVAAQSNQPDTEVEVKIMKDGRVVSRASRSGNYPIVQLSGYV